MTRILLSALAARRGGGITYLRNIVGTFPDRPDVRLSVLGHESCEGMTAPSNVEWIRAPRWAGPPITRFLFGFFYFRFLWPRRREFDLVYCAGGSFDVSLPGGVTRVVAFQNMLPFDREARRRYGPGWMRLRHWLLWFVQGWALRRADFVIFVSEHGRRAIDKLVGGRRGGSAVIRHGAERSGVPLDPDVARLLPERFVLYVSTIDAYKAQVELVEAWALLRSRRPVPEKLVLAGPNYPPYARRVRETIARHGLEQEVILLGAVRHEQIFDLTGRALVNLFLSACENCPVTLLELLCVGRPLLVSSRQPMPELGGPELAYVDPYDVPAVAAEIGRLLDDPAARRRLGEAAARRALMFSWEQCGAATWQALQAALEKGAPRPAPSGGQPQAASR
ncbi:MAG TPA: glycosyltransferase family 1 protein [Allosphingosinicella sp.]|nr:glycosyltransferase family 1 protein [Allosphingosinicella sp.]